MERWRKKGRIHLLLNLSVWRVSVTSCLGLFCLLLVSCVLSFVYSLLYCCSRSSFFLYHALLLLWHPIFFLISPVSSILCRCSHQFNSNSALTSNPFLISVFLTIFIRVIPFIFLKYFISGAWILLFICRESAAPRFHFRMLVSV